LTTPKKLKLSEEELVQALKNQDITAMRALYDMYGAALLGVILSITQHTELA